MLRGDPIVHIKDRDLAVYATIKQTDVLSAHGDHDDLMNTVKQLDKGKLKNIFLVHGEVQSMDAFATALEEEGYPVVIPEKAINYDL